MPKQVVGGYVKGVHLNEADWQQLFDLMDRVINLPDLTAHAKGQVVVAAANRLDADVVLEEFASMVDLAHSED